MNVADFGRYIFPVYMAGCFTAFAFSLRSHPDNRVLSFAFGAWIAFVYGVTHYVIVRPEDGISAAQRMRFWWYLFQMTISLLPAFCAWMLRDAGARRVVLWASVASAALCFLFFITAGLYLSFGIGNRLPGQLFFVGQSLLESLQVGALIWFSGPVVPVLRRVFTAVKQWRHWPWTHLNLPHRA